MLPKSLADDLRAEGLTVVELEGWSTYKADNRKFTPVGVMNHHTATRVGISDARLAKLVRQHNSYNVLIGRDGVVYLIGAGRMWHAGRGVGTVAERSKKGLAPEGYATKAGLTNGNTFYYGVAVANAGTTTNGVEDEPIEFLQWESLVIVNAVIQKILGKENANTSIHHREWTSRKVDLRADANQLRKEINDRMREKPAGLKLQPGTFVAQAPKGFYYIQPDGGVFGMEDAPFHGSLPGLQVVPDKPVVDAVVKADGSGYYLLSGDGGVFGFGNAPYVGSLVNMLDHRGTPVAIDIVGDHVVVYGDTLDLETLQPPTYKLGKVQ